jgi:hypothetical protein
MADWIQVEIDDFDKVRPTNVRGVEVEFFVSPYDVPEAIRGHYDDNQSKFVIDFRYVGKESVTNVDYEHVTYKVGESSGRLYGLVIDVQALRAEAVGLSVELHGNKGQELAARILDKVTGAIESLIERHPISKAREREDNYKLAKDAVLSKQAELLAIAA